MLTTLVVAACGRSPTEPTPPNTNVPIGVWSGTLTDAVNGSGTIRIELRAAGIFLPTGSWSAQFPSGALAGEAVGNVASGLGVFSLFPGRPASCPGVFGSPPVGTFRLTVSGSDSALSGQSLYTTCDRDVEGRVELHRE